MTLQGKYLYRVKIDSLADVLEFAKTAVKCRYDVAIVSGKHRLNAKSYLGVAIARSSWDEIYVEADEDCYFDFEKFIDN